MKSTVEPITDAELAEVKRLHAAAYVVEPWTVEVEEYGNSGMVTITGLERILHDTDWADPEDFGVDQDRAHWIAGITNSFRPIIARLEAAERERDTAKAEVARQWMTLTEIAELVEDYADCDDSEEGIANRPNLAMQVQMMADKATQCNPQAYAWLAARDAQQRREGAIEAFNEMRRQAKEVGQQSGLAKKMCKIFADECIEQAAQRLREGGE